jgi:hypothetical protein
MPIKYTPQVSVAWDTWTFNEHFTGIVPEMGVSRLVSSKRETHSDSFVRRGLAAIFEHGFMSTPEGRAHYIMTLAQIARAVQVSFAKSLFIHMHLQFAAGDHQLWCHLRLPDVP